MCSGFPRLPLSILAAALLAVAAQPSSARELRICSDPNNLPFSNERLEGFENRIVDLVARELGATVSYTWHAQRRGFLRETLKAGLCDLVPGAPVGLDGLSTTAPYYRSSYVFVTRADGPMPTSFDDPVLHDVPVGVQLVGDDGITRLRRMRSPCAGSSTIFAASRSTATTASQTRHRGSSRRWHAVISRSLSPGGRWPATSPRARTFQ